VEPQDGHLDVTGHSMQLVSRVLPHLEQLHPVHLPRTPNAGATVQTSLAELLQHPEESGSSSELATVHAAICCSSRKQRRWKARWKSRCKARWKSRCKARWKSRSKSTWSGGSTRRRRTRDFFVAGAADLRRRPHDLLEHSRGATDLATDLATDVTTDLATGWQHGQQLE
jgi:hypothetical protein